MTDERTRAKMLAPADLGIGQLFEHTRDAVAVADAATGRIVLWNPAAEAMFGYTAHEALGMSVSALVPRRLKARHPLTTPATEDTGADATAHVRP